MKRKILFLLATIGSLNSMNAQVSSYAFSQSSGAYTPIDGGTILGDSVSDDENFVDLAFPLGDKDINSGVGIPIGFDFTFNEVVFDRVAVNNNGWISLGQSSLSPSVDVQSSDNFSALSGISAAIPALLRNRIAGFAHDLVSQPGAELRVETIGIAPDRICVIQWKKYIKYTAPGTESGDGYNFQIRLTETSNAIDIVYGSIVNDTIDGKPQVGLGGTDELDFNNRTTTSDWSATFAGTMNSAYCTLEANIVPSSGLTFTWTPPAACTGTSIAGTVSGPVAACSGVNFKLLLTDFSKATGLAFQWESSATGLPGSFINLVDATSNIALTMQTTTTYYRCVVTCTSSGLSDTSTILSVGMNIPINCYCTSAAGGTTDEDVLNVTLGTLNNSSDCSTTGGAGSILNEYSDFTSVPAPDLALTTYVPFSVHIGTCNFEYGSAIKLFIDFNQNGSFADANETVYTSLSSVQGDHFETGLIFIPLTATPGTTRMRVVNMETEDPAFVTDCGTYDYGETEDYFVNITSAPPACTGTPVVGTAAASLDSACSNTSFGLELTGYSSNVSALAFQWQASPTGTTGTFTDISGATSPLFLTMQSNLTYYRCFVSCASSSEGDTSNVITINMNIPSNCYCISSADLVADEDILNVTLGALNNSSTCLTTGGSASILGEYSDFTSLAAVDLAQGEFVPFSVEVGTCGGDYDNAIKIYIDYNQNGSFGDSGENVYASASSVRGAHVEMGMITIPLTAALGNTRMRVVNKETNSPSTISDCGIYSYGETEDYIINITAPLPLCTGIPVAGSVTTSTDSICFSDFNLSLSGFSTDVSGLAFQWQSSPSGLTGSFTDLAGKTSLSFSTTQASTTWYQCVVTCPSSTQSATTNAIAVYQLPVEDCYCMPVYSQPCSSTDNIDSVSILSTSLMNFGTGCSSVNGTAYTVYPATGNTTANLLPGTTYTLSVTTKANNKVSVWIDYNRNGIFEGNEWTQVCATSVADVPNIVSIAIPLNAVNGPTRMRIRSRLSPNDNDSLSACTSFGSGETEDYKIGINFIDGLTETAFSNLEIYPNPTTGNLNVSFKTESNKVNVKLLNVAGQVIFNENVEHLSGTYSSLINIAQQAKGIYFLQIISDNKVTTKKVVLY